MDKLFREFNFEVKSGDAGTRRIEAIASAPSIDRDGEIISIEALKAALPGYLRNPVILASHTHKTGNGDSPVVGKCIAARVDAQGLHVTIEFADTDLGQQYWKLYQDKFQRAFSIGFMPLKYEERMIDGQRVRVFTEIELMEISCVAVPSNRDALSKAAKRKSEFVGRKRTRTARRLMECRTAKDFMVWEDRMSLWFDSTPEQRGKNFTAAEQEEFAEMERKAKEYTEAMDAYVPTPAEIRENKKLDAAEKRYAAKLGKEVDELDEDEMIAALNLDEDIEEIGDLDDIDEILSGGKDYDFAAIVRGKNKK